MTFDSVFSMAQANIRLSEGVFVRRQSTEPNESFLRDVKRHVESQG